MMNPVIKKKWIDDLESDKFIQCQGVLKKDLISFEDEPDRVGYCCLGVLCEQLYPGKFRKPYGSNDYYEIDDRAGQSADTELTDQMLDQIGMDYDDMQILIEMNDSEGKTFKEIAQYLRESLTL